MLAGAAGGAQLLYSDQAIETALTLRKLFGLVLWQVEGFCSVVAVYFGPGSVGAELLDAIQACLWICPSSRPTSRGMWWLGTRK